uniref:JmjC domain-containing protein n=1 Tax=Rhizochromulina marina TaxID=1034831 RepID=A0A7S2SRM7_9STRA|mmetsp:Transcript_5505/g.16225  ORF Transcript_5505/g.16225 Transcript_5505/m.16225 type:complete len:542 (+) Transcript_5505:304-1929(+)|eukprot:CAMPEP_0118992986 /NCGR_PEP_ID=MMETSP1173-20130426/54232_1 /TAXON_ID=1034831 /ORGANISM="Rhizochromulina marina cf, Strain CCMP1243" /LENGTH=541 /DNA_ID=CAMNT_0006944209 /DNA_START=243 /DNA_END=1868 /DNA_ORIENTATION=+
MAQVQIKRDPDVKIDDGGSRSKRRRRAPATFLDEYDMDPEQLALLHQAIQNSKKENISVEMPVEEAPVFYPTEEEFTDPIRYIASIKPQAARYGICRIIPPKKWSNPTQVDFDSDQAMPTKLQRMNCMQEGRAMGEGKQYTAKQYRAMADEFRANWIATHHPGAKPVTVEQLEKDYWMLLKNVTGEDIQVEYANDLSIAEYGSGFQKRKETDPPLGRDPPSMDSKDYYRLSGWNLNNLPLWPGSALRYVTHPIDGVNRPWLYMGMLFSSFCWHREDINLASVNYMHCGAGKHWYGVPGAKSKAFRNAMKKVMKLRLKEVPDLEHHITTQISPSTLISNQVPVYKTIQEAGQFIVTFPDAYHGGFSYGWNCAEAVNFATSDWIVHGAQAVAEYRLSQKKEVVSFDRLLFTLQYHLSDLSSVACTMLKEELNKLQQDEAYFRELLYKSGVQDVRGLAQLPSEGRASSEISDTLAQYDDNRICSVCQHTCFLSAVCCNCSEMATSCLRCCDFLCGCPRANKFILEWHSTEEIEDTIRRVEAHGV